VPRRSKHPLLIDHTHREPSSMIMNAELSAFCQSQCAKYGLTIGMKNVCVEYFGALARQSVIVRTPPHLKEGDCCKLACDDVFGETYVYMHMYVKTQF
jgi:hypothetical protein